MVVQLFHFRLSQPLICCRVKDFYSNVTDSHFVLHLMLDGALFLMRTCFRFFASCNNLLLEALSMSDSERKLPFN